MALEGGLISEAQVYPFTAVTPTSVPQLSLGQWGCGRCGTGKGGGKCVGELYVGELGWEETDEHVGKNQQESN